MKISYNWLKEYIDIDLEVNELSDILTNIGLEVEGIENWTAIEGGLEGFVVGKVLTKDNHPNADKLSITEVDTGAGELNKIVCGAPNVAAGQKVIVATVGTTITIGDESFVIKKSKIRGQLSEGMICAEDEIGMGTDHEGIIILKPDAQIGMPAKEYFDIEEDVIFEIGLTPNRIDSASHYGVARDLAAYLKQTQDIDVRRPSVEDFRVDNNNRHISIEIENPEACLRYTGLSITGVEIKESPVWLQNRLNAIGLRPINNVVDITNYVMHETGQPLHAFDTDMIKGDKVIVKTLPKGTKFLTLDEIERELHEEDLMICNAEDGMCIAGVFGGISSGVKDNTKNIFLECANFNPVYVRKTAKRHGLSTDSSYRFERGTDPNITEYTIKRTALLIKEFAGGEISSDIIDIYPKKVEKNTIDVTYRNIERLIGKRLENNTIKNILISLEIEILNETDKGLSLSVPTYRVDVLREADIIEEILRLYGYNNIETTDSVNSALSYYPKPDKEKVKNTISGLLSDNGFNEIWCNSLTKSAYCENLESFTKEATVEIFNPLSADLNAMRQTLLFGGLETVAHNINRKNSDLKLYEFGTCFSLTNKESDSWEDKYHEEEMLSLFLTGQKYPTTWNIVNEPTTFYELKAYTENVLIRLGLDPDKLESEEFQSDIFAEGIQYTRNNNLIVRFGLLQKKVLKVFDIENDVYYAEFKWNQVLRELKHHKISYEPLPKFPAVRRDLALLLDKRIKFSTISDIAHNLDKKLLKRVFLFDVFEGKNIEAGKKSYAVGFILQDVEKTLTDKQIDKVMNNLIRVFEKELGAKIR